MCLIIARLRARAHVRIEHSIGLRALSLRKCADFHENRLIYAYLSTRDTAVATYTRVIALSHSHLKYRHLVPLWNVRDQTLDRFSERNHDELQEIELSQDDQVSGDFSQSCANTTTTTQTESTLNFNST